MECTSCGRERATPEDLARWNADAPRIEVNGRQVATRAGFDAVVLGRDKTYGLIEAPMWSRAMCWTKDGTPCLMRRRWASDTFIGRARHIFDLYTQALERGETPQRIYL